jgi:hypothetical protein
MAINVVNNIYRGSKNPGIKTLTEQGIDKNLAKRARAMAALTD